MALHLRAKDLESLLKEVDAALAASQVAAVRIKLCQGVGEAPAADDSGLGMPLTRIGALNSLFNLNIALRLRWCLPLRYVPQSSPQRPCALHALTDKQLFCISLCSCAAALGKGQEHQDYVQVSLAAGGATLDRAISANSSGNDSSGGKSNRSPTK